MSQYRADGGLYYQVLIQKWLLENEQFQDYNEWLEKAAERPNSLPVYWRHLIEKPQGWDTIENFAFPEGK